MSERISRRVVLHGLVATATLSACGADEAKPRGDDDDDDDDDTGIDDETGLVPDETAQTAQTAATSDTGEPIDCVLTPKQVEGPFFFPTGLDRSDITEGRPGHPVSVRIEVRDATTCAPIEDAVVELWHADAAGVYSGYDISDGNKADATGQTFLRGHQQTDANGGAEFQTVFPGYYAPRPPHFHLIVKLGPTRLITTQLYFDDTVSIGVYAASPYSHAGAPTQAAWGPGPSALQLDLTDVAGTLTGTFRIGVDA